MANSSILLDSTGRPRSGWRFAVFCVGFAATVMGLVLFALAVPRNAPPTILRLVSVTIVLVAALFVGWLCGRNLEGLPFRSLGAWFTGNWFVNLVAGLVIGGVTFGLAVAIGVIFGGLRFEVNPIDGSVLAQELMASFLFLAVAAASEEALFRGYPFQTFVRSGLAWLAIALTSILFALVHLRNPDSGLIPAVNTALAGVWFGVAYLKTRDLWFVWGLHLMWNWVQGAIFGIEVSGITDLAPVSLLREIDSGPAWLTGAAYGVEGGIVGTIALVVSIVGIYFLPFPRVEAESAVNDKSFED